MVLQTIRLLVIALAILAGPKSLAQNVAGVFPPGFGPDHESAQYRIGFDPDSDDVVQRAHYQHSLDARRMWRVIGQGDATGANRFRADRLVGEMFWNLSTQGSHWQYGLRFDAAWRTRGRPGLLAVNWSGQYVGINDWRFRVNLLNGVQIGDGRQGGVFLQTRAQIHRVLGHGRSVGLEHFAIYGSTDDLRALDDQGHQIGPYAILPLGGGWRLHSSVLFGLTDGTPDTNLKLWLNLSF